MRAPLVAAVLFAALATAAPAVAAASTESAPAPASVAAASTTSETPVPVSASNVPPPGRRLSSDRVLRIAEALPKMKAVMAEYKGSYAGAYLKGPGRWQVSFFSRNGAKEIGQVVIADADGRVLEQWTGWQVAWSMARGYPGAFGRHVNALWIWLPLCVLFLLPFARPPFTMLHLDLLVLLSFSVSLALFNHARIEGSVPLAYPPLIYLLARMLWLLRRRRVPGDAISGTAIDETKSDETKSDGATSDDTAGPARARYPSRPVRLLVPAPWLALGVMFLIGFRVALNVTDSNVIDVGYAGVIGAEKVVHGDALYGGWPSDNEHGDTYGPVAYEAYVPFEQIFGWSGTWDDLPAAHAAAIVFDLLALGLLFWLGLRLRGPTLGVLLAYCWASYPFTLFALESNSNDTLVAVLVLAALLCVDCAPRRAARRAGAGAFAALAGLTKFAPLALAPVLATHGLFGRPDGGHMPGGGRARDEDMPRGVRVGEEDISKKSAPRARAYARAVTAFSIAFIATAALVSIPALAHDSLRTIYERTLEYQANRGSPFSVWGLYGWHTAETVVEAAAVVLAVALAVIPRRDDLIGLAAACAAIMIAVQLGIEHWFYLYIPWFFGPLMLALLGSRSSFLPTRAPIRASGRGAGAVSAGPPTVGQGVASVSRTVGQADAEARQTWPGEPDAASGSARLRLPSAAWPHSE